MQTYRRNNVAGLGRAVLRPVNGYARSQILWHLFIFFSSRPFPVAQPAANKNPPRQALFERAGSYP